MRQTHIYIIGVMAALLPQTLFGQNDVDTTKVKEQRLKEVVVSANTAQRRIAGLQIGSERMQVKELTETPALLGEADVMRSVQLLPGVKAESDASSGFQVRGGTAAQNNILYDDAPVYNMGHLAGLFSAFNDDALSTATLYKGQFPAMYGGAASAVFDISSRSGNKQGWHGGGDIGLLSCKGVLEGPLVKDRLSMLVCARRSYADLLLKRFNDFKDNDLYFYDVNAKLDYTPTQRDQLQLSFFGSKDRTALESMFDMKWINLAASLRWIHQLGSHAESHTSLLASDFENDVEVELLGLGLSFSGHIRHAALRQNFTFTFTRGELNVGGQSMLSDVKSAEWQRIEKHVKEQRRGWENHVWADAQWQLSPQWNVEAGLRLTTVSSLGGPYYYEINAKGDISLRADQREGGLLPYVAEHSCPAQPEHVDTLRPLRPEQQPAEATGGQPAELRCLHHDPAAGLRLLVGRLL